MKLSEKNTPLSLSAFFAFLTGVSMSTRGFAADLLEPAHQAVKDSVYPFIGEYGPPALLIAGVVLWIITKKTLFFIAMGIGSAILYLIFK